MEISKLVKTGINLGKEFPSKGISIADGTIFLKKSPQPSQKWEKFEREKLRKMGWPINPGTFEIRDPASPVAVVCPAQNVVLQSEAISYGAAISGPMITPDRGVELVITNTISNPNIRWIILAGKDSGHLAGDVLYCVSRYGVDAKTRRVLNTRCPTNPYVMNLSDETINRFRSQVKVINLLGGYNKESFERVKQELGLVIRCCIQEPKNAIALIDKGKNDVLYLFDPGKEDFEPMIVDLSAEKIRVYYEGYHRVGTTIHAQTIEEVYPVLKSHIINKGSWGRQESGRMALDTLATQIIIHDVNNGLFPSGWRPAGWMQNDENASDYLKKYRVWVYLFPLSDVRYDEKKKTCVPYIPEKMDYVYGGRLTAYWYELADADEKQKIKKLVEAIHKKFRYQLPNFDDVIAFYEELAKLQNKSFNQLYATAKAAKLCVKENFGNSYRLYMSLQIPPIDIKEDPRQAHNPCFALYEVYPRLIGDEWEMDTAFFMRAHDILAFPGNSNGGIIIQKFIAWYAGIKPGLYVHHPGCVHICDYMLPREVSKKY